MALNIEKWMAGDSCLTASSGTGRRNVSGAFGSRLSTLAWSLASKIDEHNIFQGAAARIPNSPALSLEADLKQNMLRALESVELESVRRHTQDLLATPSARLPGLRSSIVATGSSRICCWSAWTTRIKQVATPVATYMPGLGAGTPKNRSPAGATAGCQAAVTRPWVYIGITHPACRHSGATICVITKWVSNPPY
ncbi:hypothetical protein B0J17DRAFT_633273 [Rhizoctonia solani]|nr:hypothetical protein B0J17DRAFT_633273 [Rhizoctonia solani]